MSLKRLIASIVFASLFGIIMVGVVWFRQKQMAKLTETKSQSPEYDKKGGNIKMTL